MSDARPARRGADSDPHWPVETAGPAAGPPSAMIPAHVIDALEIGLVYFGGDSERPVVNTAARRMLGLGEGEIAPEALEAALLRLEIETRGHARGVAVFHETGLPGGGTLWSLTENPEQDDGPARLETGRPAFAAEGIGHEINNLLARLICQAEALQDAAPAGELGALAERIIETAETGAKLIGSRMIPGGPRPFDCDALETGGGARKRS